MNSKNTTLMVIGLLALLLIVNLSFFNETDDDEAVDTQKYAMIGGDVYLATSEFDKIDTYVRGDFFGIGDRLNITGGVLHDVNVVGRNVTISGRVGDDVRALAREITIQSDVGDSVLVFGESLTLSKDSSIRGDVVAFSDYLTVEGVVLGNIDFFGKKLIVGDGAFVGNYSGTGGIINANVPKKKNVVISDGARVGELKINAGNKKNTNDGESEGYFGLWNIVVLTLFGLLLGFVFGNKFALYREVRNEPLVSFGIGSLTILLLLPIVALGFILFGPYIGFLTILIYTGIVSVAFISLPLFVGEFLQCTIQKDSIPFCVYSATAGLILALLAYGGYLSIVIFITVLFVLGVMVKKCYYHLTE